MSPEQLRGARSVDHRADLWSLAVILYRALTGTLPFPAQDPDALVAQVLAEPIPPPSVAAPDLPRSLDAFFTRALARDPEARFQSARELRAAFEAAAAGDSRAPRAALSPIEIARQEMSLPKRSSTSRPATAAKQPLAVSSQRRIAAMLGALVGAAIALALGSLWRNPPRALRAAPPASASAR